MNVGSRPPSALDAKAHQIGWTIALRGLLAIVFGIIALRNPNAAAGVFVIVFAIYAFADGLLDFWLAGTLGRAGQRWGWYVFEAIATIALGVVALVYPGVTLLALVFIVALRAIAMGVLELAAAFSLDWFDSRWLLGLTGVLSIILGILLFASPGAGGLALLWTIAVYAIIIGVALIAQGMRLVRAEGREAPV
jgi:uncharacterized membrane protein HdeD (DUF308 family)